MLNNIMSQKEKIWMKKMVKKNTLELFTLKNISIKKSVELWLQLTFIELSIALQEKVRNQQIKESKLVK